jgi:hypothetical protein
MSANNKRTIIFTHTEEKNHINKDITRYRAKLI